MHSSHSIADPSESAGENTGAIDNPVTEPRTDLVGSDVRPLPGRKVAVRPQKAPQVHQEPNKAHAHPDPWLALVPMVILGGISGVAYFRGFVRPYPLAGNYKVPLQDLAKLSGASAPAANSWALTWLVLFAAYFIAFRFCPQGDAVSKGFRRAALALICGWAAFFSLNLLFMYPVGAADIFDQIFRARLLSHYGLNPFITLPANIQGDPLQQFVAWRGDASPYGPVWELLAGGTSWLAGSDLWRNLIMFKLLVILAYGINIALTYGILRAWRPDWALRGTLFFAWNPLMVFEVAGNGHNDSIVATFMLLAVFLFVTARRTAVLPALMASVLAKFVPIILGPILAAGILRDRTRDLPSPAYKGEDGVPTEKSRGLRGWVDAHMPAITALAMGAVVSVGMALILYAPFWAGPQSIGALGRQKLFTASLPKVALDLLTGSLRIQESAAQDIVRSTALVLTFAVTAGLALWVYLKGDAGNPEERSGLISRTLSACYEAIFFYLAFATLWFQPWYLIWLIALTAPVAKMANVNRTILFCIGGVGNYFVWDFIWLWNKADIRSNQISAALAIYTLPLIYSLYIWVRPWISAKIEPIREKSTSATVVTLGD